VEAGSAGEHGRENGDADWRFEKIYLIAGAGKMRRTAAENISRS
jgi:hypothetical protein